MSWSPPVPYVVGQWVRGPTFYGRRQLLDQIVAGDRRHSWVIGTRRVGKTSLLRQLELETSTDRTRLCGLYWDVEGSDSWDDLGLTLEDAVLDCGPWLADLGVAPHTLTGEPPLEILGELAGALRRRDRELLLLVDETEELARLAQRWPQELARLLGAGGGLPAFRWVLASSPRLEHLYDSGAAHLAPLDAFHPPTYLGPLGDSEAAALLRQGQLPPSARPRLSTAELEALGAACGNHPFLLQLAGRRLHEGGELEPVIDQLGSDPMVTHMVSVDLELLRTGDRQLLGELATPKATEGEHADPAAVARLLALGFIRRSPDGRLALASTFLERCLHGLCGRLRS